MNALVSDKDQGGLLIAISGDGNPNLPERLLRSLIDCAEELRALNAEVLLLNNAPGCEAILGEAKAAFSWRSVSEAGGGFTKRINIALREAAQRRRNILLLDSGMVVFPGAICEMARVAGLDPMIGFVTTHGYPNRSVAEAAKSHAVLAAYVPDFTYMPVVTTGSVLLVKWQVIAELGSLDEIYEHRTAAQADLVMRAGRCGSRIVIANKALIPRDNGETAASARPRDQAILRERYPEFYALAEEQIRSPESQAEALLGTLLRDQDGLLDLAFDFSTFVPSHNGTMKAGLQLLEAAADSWRDRFRLHVLCSEDAYQFHNCARLGIPRRDPLGPERFAVIFRVGAPYNLATLERLAPKGLILGLYLLDTIPIDCTHYTSQTLFNVWQFALSHIDVLATPSDFSAQQIRRRFTLPPDLIQTRAPHALDLAAYRRELDTPPGTTVAALTPGYLLIIGNQSWHKFVVPTSNRLAAARPDRQVIALGIATPETSEPQPSAGDYPPPRLDARANLLALESGPLDEADIAHLYAKAAAVIYPSHYEGFGFPVLEALAMRKPVFVRRLPVFEELRTDLGDNPNIHFYDTTEELTALLAIPPVWAETPDPGESYRAMDTANDIRRGIETALANIRYDRAVARIRAVQWTRIGADPPGPRHGYWPDVAGRGVERAVAFLLSYRAVHTAARFVFHRAARRRAKDAHR